MQKAIILDASALIALLFEEKGMTLVESHLPHAQISSVNLTEVVSFLIKQGITEQETTGLIEDLALTIVDYDPPQAFLAGALISKTMHKGLSLGDRACLALAIQHDLPVLTADKTWAELHLPVKIKLIR